jgi:hypothetical protein
MDDGPRKEDLFDRMALSSEVEKSKEEVLVVSVEKEKLRMDLIESKNNMLLLQSRLDATQLENAAVQAAVLSIEIQKLNGAIKQYKEQAKVSATEKKGLMNELDAMKAEAAEADARNKKIRELQTERDDLVAKLFKSTTDCNQAKAKVEALQTDISDLNNRLFAKEEETIFFKNASFANTKKNESEKADLQVKLSSTQAKLDAALSKIDIIIAEKDKNARKADEDIKGLNLSIASLNTHLEEVSHKSSAAVAANIAASFQNKKDVAALTEINDMKDREIQLFKKQSNKSVTVLNNMFKLIAGFEQHSEEGCKVLSMKLLAEGERLRAIRAKLAEQENCALLTKERNMIVAQEREAVKEQLQLKNDDFEKTSAALRDLEAAMREQKSECKKAKLELENAKSISEKATADHDADVVARTKAHHALQREIEQSALQIEQTNAANLLLNTEVSRIQPLLALNEKAEGRIVELLEQIRVADERQEEMKAASVVLSTEVSRIQPLLALNEKAEGRIAELLEQIRVADGRQEEMKAASVVLSTEVSRIQPLLALNEKAEGRIAELLEQIRVADERQEEMKAASVVLNNEVSRIQPLLALNEKAEGRIVELLEQIRVADERQEEMKAASVVLNNEVSRIQPLLALKEKAEGRIVELLEQIRVADERQAEMKAASVVLNNEVSRIQPLLALNEKAEGRIVELLEQIRVADDRQSTIEIEMKKLQGAIETAEAVRHYDLSTSNLQFSYILFIHCDLYIDLHLK